MKKILIMSAASLIIAASVNGQTTAALKKDIKSEKTEESAIKKEKRTERKELRTLKGKEVSYQAKQAFGRDFGDIAVTKWVRTTNFDKATFTKDGNSMSAYYDDNAKLVGTTSYKTFADLPADAQKDINKNYAGYTKKAVVFFDDNENNDTDMMLYGSQFDDADNYFVELSKGSENIVLQVNMEGRVFYFKKL